MMLINGFKELYQVYKIVLDDEDNPSTSWFDYMLIPTNDHHNYDPEDYTSAKCFAEWYSAENNCDVAVITVKPTEILTMRSEEVLSRYKIGVNCG